jgi:hypothetical protein
MGCSPSETRSCARRGRATGRAETLKALLVTLTVTRDRMLQDSVRPLVDALGRVKEMAPHVASWSLVGDVGADEMSTAERYRATIALVLAVAQVRRAPWVGLFLDNFEQIDDSARPDVVAQLRRAVQLGYADNVLLAAATDLPCDDSADVRTLRLQRK